MFEDFEHAMEVDRATTRRVCAFTRWVRTLDIEDRKRAEMLLFDTDWSCRQLARYFQSKGATFNDQVLTRHRNGTCCGQRS